MMTSVQFGAILKPVAVSSPAKVNGKEPVIYQQKAFAAQHRLSAHYRLSDFDNFKITGADACNGLKGCLYTKNGEPVVLTNDGEHNDLDGYTDATTARTEIQDTVNLVNEAIKGNRPERAKALMTEADTMKQDVLDLYLQENRDRIEEVPYYLSDGSFKDGWRRLMAKLKKH